MTEKQSKACQLYLGGQLTQKEIAWNIGVSERTLYTWIRVFSWQRVKEAALAAPALIAEKVSSQIVELLNSISSREPGQRYPNMQEAEITRKMINCLDKLKRYPTIGQTMQSVQSLIHFIDQKDHILGHKVNIEYNEFLKQQTTNNFKPFEMEYNVNPTAFTQPGSDDTLIDEDAPDYNAPILENYAASRVLIDEPVPEQQKEEIATVELPEGKMLFLGNIVDSSVFEPFASLPVTSGFDSKPAVYPPQGNCQVRSSLTASSPLTTDDFENYKYCLKDPSPSEYHEIRFNGKIVQRSWLEYNLFQFCLPPHQRFFIADTKEYAKMCEPQVTCQQIHRFFKDNDIIIQDLSRFD